VNLTTRQSFRKPLATEQYDIAHQNFNWDKADALSGVFVVTSTTRPSSPFEGQTIWETDTKKQYIRSAGAWVLATNTNGLKGGKRYDTVNAALATLAAGSAGTEALANMDTGSVALEAATTCQVRVRVEVASSIANDGVTFRIRQNNVAGLSWGLFLTPLLVTANRKYHFEFSCTVIISTAGNYTFALTAQRASGTGAITISSTAEVKPFMLIEQVGPSNVLTAV
jgi:hypothetical protein